MTDKTVPAPPPSSRGQNRELWVGLFVILGVGLTMHFCEQVLEFLFSTFEETVQFAIDTAIDLPRFAILTPFPGTPLHARLEREGRILTRNWERYDGQHVVFRPALMSPHDLQQGHERAWRGVYSYRSIARRLASSRTQLPIAIMANLGYRYYAYHLESHYTCDWPIGLKEAA